MKTIKYSLLPILLLQFFFYSVKGQTPALSTPSPEIGTLCPKYQLSGIINFPEKTVMLPSFSGKYLILDFWATWCGACVEAIPREDSLQKKYAGNLQFMMISDEKESRLKAFFDKAKLSMNISLPCASDTSYKLARLFKIRFIPHYVWIDKKGIIRAITDADQITDTNISKFISGLKIDLPVKEDEQRVYFDTEKPLLSDTNLIKPVTLTQYNMVSSYLKGYSGMAGQPTHGIYAGRRFWVTNQPIAHLYRLAYGNGYPFHDFPYYRTFVHVKDSTRIDFGHLDNFSELTRKYAVCYDLIIPKADSGLLFKTMRHDLDRLYGLRVTIEKRRMKCLVLKLVTPGLLHSTASDPQELSDQLSITLLKVPFDHLAGDIYEAVQGKNVASVIDETGIHSIVDIHINADLKNIGAFNKELSRYGLSVTSEYRDIDVMIITD